MIKQVISGCQTGADQSGLRAALDCGLLTGGYVTRGNRTLDGPRPDLIKKFNLMQTDCIDYSNRTFLNVSASDGTIRFAGNFNSAGEKCTLRAIKFHNKPYFDIDIFNIPYNAKELLSEWVRSNNIETLNIAGNSEKTQPGIGKIVYDFLVDFFEYIKTTR